MIKRQPAACQLPLFLLILRFSCGKELRPHLVGIFKSKSLCCLIVGEFALGEDPAHTVASGRGLGVVNVVNLQSLWNCIFFSISALRSSLLLTTRCSAIWVTPFIFADIGIIPHILRK